MFSPLRSPAIFSRRSAMSVIQIPWTTNAYFAVQWSIPPLILANESLVGHRRTLDFHEDSFKFSLVEAAITPRKYPILFPGKGWKTYNPANVSCCHPTSITVFKINRFTFVAKFCPRSSMCSNASWRRHSSGAQSRMFLVHIRAAVGSVVRLLLPLFAQCFSRSMHKVYWHY